MFSFRRKRASRETADSLKSRHKLVRVAAASAIAVPLISAAAIQGGQVANAASSSSSLQISGYQTFYAYAEAGDDINVAFRKAALSASGQNITNNVNYTFRVQGAGIPLQNCTITTANPIGSRCYWEDANGHTNGLTATQDGVVEIQVRPTGATSTNAMTGVIFDWAIGVVGESGRVWSSLYRAAQPHSNPLVGDNFWLHYLNPQGYLYSAGYSNYNGIYSNLIASKKGVILNSTGNSAYRSIEQSQAGAGKTYSTIGANNPAFLTFFETPDINLPTNATLPDGTNITLNNRANPLVPTFTNTGVTYDAVSDTATFTWTQANTENNRTLIDIDTNGNGSFTDAVDVRNVVTTHNDGTHSYVWNMRQGDANGAPNGARVANGTTGVKFRVSTDREGEIHLTNTDVEKRGGLRVVRQNSDANLGISTPTPTWQINRIFWNDTGLSTAGRQVTSNRDGSAGVDSTPYIHNLPSTGGGTVDGWGNARIIDDWAYVSTRRSGEATFDVPTPAVPHLTVSKSSVASGTRGGDTIDYTITATNDGTADHASVTVVDDLTDVLDDANLDVSSIQASVAGNGITFDAATNRITWEGPLAIGESVDITFTVTAHNPLGGDNSARNPVVAVVDPTEVPAAAFECSDVTATDLVACDEVVDVFTPEGLGITKTSVLDADARTIEYTVTGTNTGDFNYTAGTPAFIEDSLDDVLDDGSVVATSVVSSRPGGVDYDTATGRISWAGALPIGASVNITFTVNLDKLDGNGSAENFAAISNDPANIPTDPFTCADVTGSAVTDCAEVADTLPAEGLEITKTSVLDADARTIEYVVTGTNTGNIAYTADVPAFIEDSLTDVLDDGSVVEDSIESDLDGGIDFNETDERITWAGALPIGASVNITFTVNLDKLDGNGSAENFAAISNDPANIPTDPFTCADVTGSAVTDCAEVADTLPAPPASPDGLTLIKTNDATSGGVTFGDTVNYTVTFQNTGEVPFTDSTPATVVDDLTDVLDDADLDTDSIEVSRGSATFDEATNRITWVGPIDVDEVVTLTYSVNVKTAEEIGDNEDTVNSTLLIMNNTAIITDDPTTVPTDPFDCEEVQGIDGVVCDNTATPITTPDTPDTNGTPDGTPDSVQTGGTLPNLALLGSALIAGGLLTAGAVAAVRRRRAAKSTN